MFALKLLFLPIVVYLLLFCCFVCLLFVVYFDFPFCAIPSTPDLLFVFSFSLAFCVRCSNVPRMPSDDENASTYCDSITCPVFHRRLNLFSDELYYRIALDSTLDW